MQEFLANLRECIFHDSDFLANIAENGCTRKKPDIRFIVPCSAVCLRAIFSSSINRGWIKAFTNKNDQWQQTLISLFLPELTASVQYIFSLFVHTAALNQCQNSTGKYYLPFLLIKEILYPVCDSIYCASSFWITLTDIKHLKFASTLYFKESFWFVKHSKQLSHNDFFPSPFV